MAYIYYNGEKYFPVKSFGDDIMELSYETESFFEVDELMAIPIAALNNKGYITEMSCAGHAISDLMYESLNETDLDTLRKEKEFVLVKHHEENDVDYVCWIDRPIYDEAFILFKKAEQFSNLPDGWKYEQGRLSCNFAIENNPLSFYSKISKALYNLMMWIEKLPQAGFKEVRP